MESVVNFPCSHCKIAHTWSFKHSTFLFPKTQTAKPSTKTKSLPSTLSRCHAQFFSPPLPPHNINTSSTKHTTLHVEPSHEYQKLKALLEILMEKDCCPLQLLRDDGDWTRDQFWAVIRFLIHASRPRKLILQFCIFTFMTLVEPRGGDDQKATRPEILTAVQNPEQPKPASLPTGWFHSITHAVNESPGRKKNEEIIAKVTNWSTGKQHTPLQSLLGNGKPLNQKESLAPAPQKDDKAAMVSGHVTTTVTSILNPESPTGQAAKKETAKEWNSPARYPSDTKSEKRKVKGRSWAQFVCCASVN